MATYKKGILGVFSGKVGTVIGSSWKGVDYMRSLPKSSSKAPSQLQLDQRLRFATVANFIKPIKMLTSIGYGSVTGNISPFNAAVSYHLNEAITGSSPDFGIDYPKVVFSKGELPGPSVPNVAAGIGSLNFSWIDNSAANLAQATDKAVILVYNTASKEFMYSNEATRDSGTLELLLPPNFVGETLHAWMAFFAANDKQVSTSVYLGTIVAS